MIYSPIALSIGDICGIGPEIIVQAFAQAPEHMAGCCVIGDVAVLQRAAEMVQAPGLRFQAVADISECLTLAPNTIAVLAPSADAPLPSSAQLLALPIGQVQASAGRYAAACIRTGANLALRGKAAALVTAPIHKEALAAAGEPYPGHTELLQAEAAAFAGRSLAQMPVRMMLANPELRTVLVSIHVSLRQALEAVTHENIVQTLLITHRALTPILGHAPRIAVAGLNPHAGEGGLFGREEVDTIAPAIAQARAAGVDALGPLAPDTVFMRARNTPNHPGEFDVVLAMYHDQGLIPVKYLGVEQGVNVTLGLPLIRTSPDHGTAFDIAGQGVADPASLVQAVCMARQMAGLSVR